MASLGWALQLSEHSNTLFCCLRWTETKNLKILIIDNFSPCHLMVMKLYNYNAWEYIAKTKVKINFCNGHRLIKLTKKCIKASLLVS